MLMLLPAALLVLLILGAVAVDAAVAFMGQREAAALAASAAGDGIVAAADADAFYTDEGALVLDPERLQAAAEAVVADTQSSALEVTGVEATCEDTDGLEVTVRVDGVVGVVFSPAVGDLDQWEVTAASTMTADGAAAFVGVCGG